MCLIVFAYRSHPDYPLILVANRDEFYQRPTQPAQFWPDAPGMFAGKDLEAGGTWMGINIHNRRFAAVTNFREDLKPVDHSEGFISRGNLVKDYLCDDTVTTTNYLQKLSSSGPSYRGYNLLLWENQQLFYFSNKSNRNIYTPLKTGIYGLSNGLLDNPWPKVVKGKQFLVDVMESEINTNNLLAVLQDRDIADDAVLPDTGIGIEGERSLSPCFIHTEKYGTRSTTVFTIDNHNNIQLVEQNWNIQGEAEQQRLLQA